ncbi:MAG: TRAP transporter substrate-binding protein [Candidatus Competibacter denitrificans]|jgi:C4-dicarboxylate-binding protein DctP
MRSQLPAVPTLLASLLLTSLAGIAPAAWSAEAIVIKFSHVVAPDTPKGRAADKFKELANTYTSGKAKVEVYPNSQLYKDKEELEALQLGAVHMLAPSLAKFGPLGAKEFEVFDFPCIFPNYTGLHKVTQGPLGKQLLDKLDSKGITGLAYWDNGFKIFSSNKPIKAVEDFKGQKLRIQSSKVLDAQMRALSAIPQVMAFSEVYQALQTGVVDGTENPPSNMYTQKMHEVQKFAMVSNHGYLGYAVITNKKFWEGLPADVRTGLEKAMKEATVYANEVAGKDNEDALAAMKASGKTEFYQPSAAEHEALCKAMAPVYEEMGSRVGKDLITSIQKEAAAK